MGHTAGVHTRSREAAVRFGSDIPASRITVNTPTTHGAIGFSTALPPSMTLGCGSWGGNVTSDNVSPLHLLDIKRVAFETRPVKSARPAAAAVAAVFPVSVATSTAPPAVATVQRARQAQATAASTAGKINREEIAAIVDRFLAARPAEKPTERPAEAAERHQPQQQPSRAPVEAEAGSMYTGPTPGRSDSKNVRQPANGVRSSLSAGNAVNTSSFAPDGKAVVDFVSEDDVRRAIQKGEKIYINAKTIITPAARDIGEPGEVFAKG
jgi:acetaldehyde dehydrogenase (acetylating)